MIRPRVTFLRASGAALLRRAPRAGLAQNAPIVPGWSHASDDMTPIVYGTKAGIFQRRARLAGPHG